MHNSRSHEIPYIYPLKKFYTEKTCQVKNQRDKIWASEEEVYSISKKRSHIHT